MNYDSQKIGDVSISAREFASDYHKGVEIFDRFQMAPDFDSAAKYATFFGFNRTLNRNEYLQVYQEFKRWAWGKRPQVIQAITRLHFMGIFPGKNGYQYQESQESRMLLENIDDFNTRNKYFELICLIISLLFWSGHRQQRQRTDNDSNKNATLIFRKINNPDSAALISKLIIGLERIDFCISIDRNNRNYFNKDGSLNAYISRFVGFLGAMLGCKTRNEMSIPAIIQLAKNEFQEKGDKIESYDMELAYNILRDFILTFFITRCYSDKYSARARSTIAHYSEKESKKRINELLDILRFAGFNNKIELRPYNSANAPSEKSYSSRILFPTTSAAHIQRLRYEMEGRIDALLKKATSH